MFRAVSPVQRPPAEIRRRRNRPVIRPCGVSMRKRHALHQTRHIDFGDGGHFAEVALALAVLALGKVTASLLPSQDFAGAGDLEPLGDAFPRLASSNFLSHRRARRWQTSPT